MDIIWIGVAFLFGFGVSKIKLPPLVGFLLAGITLSIAGYEPGEMLHEISHLGVIFLLFTVGLHIRLKNILRFDILGVSLSHLLLSVLIFTPIALAFGFEPQAALIIAIMLGFSSTVLTAKNLERRNELGAFYGRSAIGILIVQDLVAIGLIAYTGGGAPSYWALSLFALPL
ncbi:MAG: cation:proton antiporter, partial [Balneolaceae bacterium]|nr:cation:proton antiporter [Balneolaceae bacterium]